MKDNVIARKIFPNLEAPYPLPFFRSSMPKFMASHCTSRHSPDGVNEQNVRGRIEN